MSAQGPDRPDLYVVARFLECLWREDEPMLKTRLQVAANVNYDVFTRYLEWMCTRDLASLENSADGHERVALTPKGREAYRKLVQWINEVVEGRFPRL
jgi:predicted transcriptional regulator